MWITLTWAEVLAAATVGLMRQIAALKANCQDKHGFAGLGWSEHIEGACGECAAAKALGVYWQPTINTFSRGSDVAGYQVRTRSRSDYDLLIRDNDDPAKIFILVLGRCPTYEVVGWLRALDARRQEWRQDYGERGAAWFVPRSHLLALADLGFLPF